MLSFSVSARGLDYQSSRLLTYSFRDRHTYPSLSSCSLSPSATTTTSLAQGPKKIAKIKTARGFPFAKHEKQREMKIIFAYYTCIRCFRTVDYPQNRTLIKQTGRIINNYQQNYR